MKKWHCVFCSKRFLNISLLERHLRHHTNERPFPCSICEKSYREKGTLVSHIKTHKNIGKQHKCNQCSAAFTLPGHLKNHLIGVHNVLKLPKEECPTCGKVFTKGSKLAGHQLRVHTQLEKQHECIICNKWFMDFQQLKYHLMVHTGEKPFHCPKCPASFSRVSHRRAHLITKHDVGVRLRCPVCNKSASSKASLEMHMRVHTNEKPFSCSMCSKSCATASTLKCHMRVHTAEKRFCCKVCGKGYSDSTAYKSHCQRHTWIDSRSHKCDECPLSFYAKPTLKRHIKFVHRKKRPFVCNICGRGFQTPSNRDRHINTHLRENHYKCEICGKVLNYFASLTRHMKTEHSKATCHSYPCSKCPLILKNELHFSRHYLLNHTDSKEDPLTCLFCNYRCSTLKKLEFHYSKHTRERPHFCSKCPKSFGSSDNLSVHYHSLHSSNSECSKSDGFRCPKCPYIFKGQLQLSCHYLVDHVGSSADFLKCVFCSFRAISSLRDLEYHYNQHTRERPYFCTNCPQIFGTLGAMRGHCRTAHTVICI